MHQPVDRRGRRHRVLEDLLPLRERQVARHQHTPPLVPFRQQREQYLHLLPALLYIAQIVDHQGLPTGQPLQQCLERQVALGHQQVLHQQAARRTQHPPTRAHQLLAQPPPRALPSLALAPPPPCFRAPSVCLPCRPGPPGAPRLFRPPPPATRRTAASPPPPPPPGPPPPAACRPPGACARPAH